ncbi:efflux RND transporter permease subunit [Oligoflexus tunisiensis]|uniref:efflux RND transporter permease subunit n=1 Tax=Oligoflexus tunisiensis TaxID=708132 RepID=UPI000AA09ED7|nr:CusA/CzcA family heavy metal efflux RND transporter [Oligoflexus tunisiensis]
MLNRIIHFAVFHRVLTLFLTLLLVTCGLVFGFRLLPIDAVPDITNNQVQINTTITGLAPEEIERSITFPVESSMRGLPQVDSVRSITRFGLSQITVIFEDGVDVYRARQMVSERLQNVLSDLPTGATTRLGPISTGLGEIYQYTLDYKNVAQDPEARFQQLIQLRTYQDWTIKPRLLTVKGVAEVNTTGGYEKQYQVEPDREKMQAYGIHFSDLKEALEGSNRNVGGGQIQQTAEQFLVQGIGLFKSPEEIKLVPVKQLESLRVVRLGEVAAVTLGREQRTGAATMNGEEVVLGTVMMLMGDNSRAVAKAIDARIEEIRRTLPPDLVLATVYDRSELVDHTIQTVQHNLLFGALLVTLVLFALLGNMRAALITALTIPFTLSLTFLLMRPLGLSGNLMSLGALDFGMIVDGTVIVLDNCVRMIQSRAQNLGRGLTSLEKKQAIHDATVEIRKAAGFGELIIVVVFLPIFALVGVEGKMFKPMATAFSIAVLGALLLSFTTVPALASFVLSGKGQSREPWLMRILTRIYEPILHLSFRFRLVFITGALLAIAVSLLLFSRMGAVFLPQLGEGSYAFHMIRPVNISLDQSIAFQKTAERVLRDVPEVQHVFSRIGTSEVATDPMGVNVSDTYIMLKDQATWPLHEGRKHNFESLAQHIVELLEREVPGQNYLASQPIQMRFNELMEGTRADVAIKVFGNDLDKNLDTAREIREIVEAIPGAGDVELDLAGTSPVLKIEPKPEALIRFGTSVAEVFETVAAALGGEEAGFIHENEQKVPIFIRLGEAERSDLDVIRSLPVGISHGISTRLDHLADLEFADTFGSINRENGMRRAAVLVNLRGRDTESFVQEAQARIAEKIQLPENSFIEWGGNFQNLQEARLRLLILTPLALCLVFFMVYAAFGNAWETLLIFIGIPLAWVGGILNLWLNDLPFSISAGVGFIALSGIAVLNGVVLIGFYNTRKAQGENGVPMIMQATVARLRPVVMTALVAIFGFLPMMFSKGMGAEVQKPLATVVTGGVLSATVLTLFILPMLFSLIEKRVRNFRVTAH